MVCIARVDVHVLHGLVIHKIFPFASFAAEMHVVEFARKQLHCSRFLFLIPKKQTENGREESQPDVHAFSRYDRLTTRRATKSETRRTHSPTKREIHPYTDRGNTLRHKTNRSFENFTFCLPLSRLFAAFIFHVVDVFLETRSERQSQSERKEKIELISSSFNSFNFLFAQNKSTLNITYLYFALFSSHRLRLRPPLISISRYVMPSAVCLCMPCLQPERMAASEPHGGKERKELCSVCVGQNRTPYDAIKLNGINIYAMQSRCFAKANKYSFRLNRLNVPRRALT